jgi:hypothetical protein
VRGIALVLVLLCAAAAACGRRVAGPATLTVTCSGPGAIASTPPGATCGQPATFRRGTVVTLAETAAGGASFGGFGGACAGDACRVAMGDSRQVTARFDPSPPVRWSARLGEEGDDHPRAVLAIPGGALVSGASDGKGWIARVDDGATIAWKDELDAAALAEGSDAIYAAGTSLVRLGADGAQVWTRPLAAPAVDVAIAPGGDVVVLTANELLRFAPDGTRGIAFGVAARARALAAGELLYVAHDTGLAIAAPDGAIRDGRAYPGVVGALALASPDGEPIVGGAAHDRLFVGQRSMPCDACTVRSVALAGDALVASGSFHGAVDLGRGPITTGAAAGFVVSWDAAGAGQVRWSLKLALASDVDAPMLATDGAVVYVAGAFAGALDLGAGRLDAAGSTDVYVLAIAR